MNESKVDIEYGFVWWDNGEHWFKDIVAKRFIVSKHPPWEKDDCYWMVLK